MFFKAVKVHLDLILVHNSVLCFLSLRWRNKAVSATLTWFICRIVPVMRGVASKPFREYTFNRTLMVMKLKDIFYCIDSLWAMQKGHHGNILSFNLDFPVLEEIKVVAGTIGKNKKKNLTKMEHFSPTNAFKRNHLAIVFGTFLRAYLLHFRWIYEKRNHVFTFKRKWNQWKGESR